MTRLVLQPFFVLLLIGGCVADRMSPPPDRQKALNMVDRGTILLREGKLEDADAAFSLALQFATIPEAADGLGCVRMVDGRLDEAERLFIISSQIDAGYGNAFGNLGAVYESKGMIVEARRAYEKALTKDPGNFRARNNLAALQYDRGEERVAEILLREARALSPDPLIDKNISTVEED